MTDRGKHITLAGVRDTLSLYGSVIDRWPEADRDEALAMSEHSMTFKRLLEQEVRLENDLFAADDIEAKNAHIRAASLAEHITAQARRIAQHAHNPETVPDPTKFRRLSKEKPRGFRLLPKGFSDVARRLIGIRQTAVRELLLLPAPEQEVSRAGTPTQIQQYNDGHVAAPLASHVNIYSGLWRWSAGLSCCFIAGLVLGDALYTRWPAPVVMQAVDNENDMPISLFYDGMSFNSDFL